MPTGLAPKASAASRSGLVNGTRLVNTNGKVPHTVEVRLVAKDGGLTVARATGCTTFAADCGLDDTTSI